MEGLSNMETVMNLLETLTKNELQQVIEKAS